MFGHDFVLSCRCRATNLANRHHMLLTLHWSKIQIANYDIRLKHMRSTTAVRPGTGEDISPGSSWSTYPRIAFSRCGNVTTGTHYTRAECPKSSGRCAKQTRAGAVRVVHMNAGTLYPPPADLPTCQPMLLVQLEVPPVLSVERLHR